MRFDLAPLQHALGGPSHAMFAELVGVERATVAKWTQRGLSVHQADRVAVAVGYHPAEVWADWWDVTACPCGNDRCNEVVLGHKFCSGRCRWAARQRRRNPPAPPGCPHATRETVAA